ncbi:MAG: hypothetical protein CMP22_06355 [Rickettsiales bacterium]|nr:hypothetical protein [Rickettsiales bacterium]|tara:strand:- start:350 stop:781 length:432 start_codon:yes stop_codon:yes gene_type:complete
MTYKQNFALMYFAGLVGGLVNAFLFFYADDLGLSSSLDLNLSLEFDRDVLYQRMIFGGVWALAFILPDMLSIWPKNGLFNVIAISLLPTAFTLFYMLPEAGRGMIGQNIGELMPVFVFILNFVWALVTYMTGSVLGLFKRSSF